MRVPEGSADGHALHNRHVRPLSAAAPMRRARSARAAPQNGERMQLGCIEATVLTSTKEGTRAGSQPCATSGSGLSGPAGAPFHEQHSLLIRCKQALLRPKSQSVPLSGLSRLGCVPRCGQRVKLSSFRRVQTNESCGFGSGLDVRLAAHSHYLRCGEPLRLLLLCAEYCRVRNVSSPQAAYLYFGLGWSVLTEHWNRWLRNTIFSTTYNPSLLFAAIVILLTATLDHTRHATRAMHNARACNTRAHSASVGRSSRCAAAVAGKAAQLLAAFHAQAQPFR